jgi:hypothetical protein
LLISVSAQDGVGISGKDGAPILTTDPAFPYALEFHDTRGVTRNHLQGISVNYKTKTSAFELKIKTLAALREEEQGFLLDMFAPRKITSERIVGFRVDPNENLAPQQSGLMIRPGEALQVQGRQAQDAFWAAADKEGSKLLIRELLDDQESGTSQR